MIILGIESSALTVSAALMRDGRLLCEYYCNNGLTHSVTLLPAVAAALEACSLTPADLDLIALAAGPGSFTGLRIGAATVKGLAAAGTPCFGVSTLEAMAYDHRDFEGIVCACMDARCGQVYNALFEGGSCRRLCDDRALALGQLVCQLQESRQQLLLVGDGAALCLAEIEKTAPELRCRTHLAPENRRFQHAWGVCAAAAAALEAGEEPVPAQELALRYLRLPQAERELAKKEKKQ